MRFLCKKFPTSGPKKSFSYYPYLTVELFNSKDRSKSAKVEGLIDSGADCSIIEAGYAHILLDVDYKQEFMLEQDGFLESH